ncbi:hypothetical protein [Ekhidna sp.]|uniref:hypothetical protein n=1 Tax=Ekhidna sp. TaxID=2608089 RepID=UPI003CCBD018
MKKHHHILISLLLCASFWVYQFFVLPGSETLEKMMLGLVYLTVLGLMISIVLFNRHLNTWKKLGWIVFGVILLPVLPLVYYFKYKDEIQRIIVDTNSKMREGPKSLDEFDSSSYR